MEVKDHATKLHDIAVMMDFNGYIALLQLRHVSNITAVHQAYRAARAMCG